MRNKPDDCSDDTINRLFDLATEITKQHAADLQADPTLAARLDADPELQSIQADKLLSKVTERAS
jgi:hypothetical protein